MVRYKSGDEVDWVCMSITKHRTFDSRGFDHTEAHCVPIESCMIGENLVRSMQKHCAATLASVS